MPKKKGPPYLDIPDCKYVVIIDPWGMSSARDRRQIDVDRVGAWIRFMLRDQAQDGRDILPEAIFMRGTQNEVIIQLPEYIELDPILGEHRWPEFLNNLDGHNRSKTASYIFEYNYRSSGEPGNHNWSDHFATAELPPSWFPVKYPYPRAHYADVAGFVHLRNLIMPLPSLREPTPPNFPNPDDIPVDDPSHLTPYPDVKDEMRGEQEAEPGESIPVIKAENDESEQKLLFVEKNDPYEEEENALQGLHSTETKQEPVDHSIVKQEDVSTSNYQPSAALLESLATLSQNRLTSDVQASKLVVKKEEDPSDYVASKALSRAIEQYQSRLHTPSNQPRIKIEANNTPDSISIPTRQQSDINRDPRRRSSDAALKRPKEEYDDTYSLKRIKKERI